MLYERRRLYKFMKRKYILMFMYLLTSVCIFSIGFSSWTIVQNATIDTSGNIIAEDIVSDDKYIYLNTKLGDNENGIDIFEYYDRCFITYVKDSLKNEQVIDFIIKNAKVK